MTYKPRDYVLEGALTDRLMNESGARPEDLDDIWLPEIRAGLMTRANYDERIAMWKSVAPHRFVGCAPSDEHTAFIRDAWVLGRATSQAQYVKKYGLDEAKRQAGLCGNPFDGTPGSIGKPGRTPPADESESGKKAAKSRLTNPWNTTPEAGFVDAKGKFTAKAIAAQAAMIRGLGLAAAQKSAEAFGLTVGSTGVGSRAA
jgi:hypothetical protein